MRKWFITVMLICIIPNLAYAAPKEIIIIRHADKLDQEETGPALSALGIMRSIKFAYYFLEKFGEPDFIISADSKRADGKEVAIRSLQTVAPLANMLAARYPQEGFEIHHPFSSSEYAELADDILTNEMYDNKLLLVCWSHQRIPKLTRALGVTDEINEWPKYDYDTVYVLRYNRTGNVDKFTVLKNQFPVKAQDSWDELRNRLFRST